MKYPEQYINNAIAEYTAGTLMKDVLNKYGISSATLLRHMKKNNINYKNDHGRKNFFNKHYFDIINTEDKAYWLGFIYADGCITKTDKTQTTENRLSINISNKDIELLYKFAKSIDYIKPKVEIYTPNSKTYGSNKMCRITLNSIELVNSLKRHGINTNKTFNISFPYSSLPTNLYRHFIRGFFDGDGTVCTTYNSYYFGLIGQKNFLLEIQDILINNCKLNKLKLYPYPHKSIDIYDLRYGGKLQLKRIFNFLYNNSSIYLERKYIKFKSLFS